MWGYGHMGGLGYGIGFGFGWIFMILFWGLVIWGILTLVRGTAGRGCWGGHCDAYRRESNKALDILKERYAKGELSKEDFERMKKDLE